MFLGDTHGDLDFADRALDEAWTQSCDAIFQVGDFGFLWPKSGDKYLRELDDLVRLREIPLFWIDGNHDWHPEIRKRYPAKEYHVLTGSELSPQGVHHVRRGSQVHVQGPGDVLDNYESRIRIVGLGGAPSIDYKMRREGVNWWPEELITDEDANQVPLDIFGNHSRIDILATHDAPAAPPGFGPIRDETFNHRVAGNRAQIEKTIKLLNPRLLVHGHYHSRYTKCYDPDEFGPKNLGRKLTVEGLDCNSGKFPDTYLIVKADNEGNMSWRVTS